MKDLGIYLERMEKSMKDKLFFLDFMDEIDTVVDFGCANGAMIKVLAQAYPEKKFIGYDNSIEMVREAKFNLASFDNVVITNKLPVIRKKDNCALILSSVLHEIYSYCIPREIARVIQWINNSYFKLIFIRDMAFMREETFVLDHKVHDHIAETQDNLRSFELKWGSIEKFENFLHYCLKYRYKENWERENNENYFACNFPLFLSQLTFYHPIWKKTFNIPFIINCVKEDFGIDIHMYNTHFATILRRHNPNGKDDVC